MQSMDDDCVTLCVPPFSLECDDIGLYLLGMGRQGKGEAIKLISQDAVDLNIISRFINK